LNCKIDDTVEKIKENEVLVEDAKGKSEVEQTQKTNQ